MMKKTIFVFAAVAMLAACGQKGNQGANASGQDSLNVDSVVAAATDTLVYEGEGPAADGTYQYRLALYGDSVKEYEYEEIAVTPKGTETMARGTGLAALISKDGKQYIRVQQVKPDSVTFLQLNDSTLRLVSDKFEEAASGVNTDLKLKR